MSLMEAPSVAVARRKAGWRAVIMLAGSSRRPELAAAGRSPLDLPLGDGRNVLDRLLSDVEQVRADAGGRLDVRLLVGNERAGPGLSAMEPKARANSWLKVEKDSNPLRGTGGALVDATLEYGEDDLILVLQAVQVSFQPIAETARALLKRATEDGSDVVIATDAAGTPEGAMLVRCGALRGLKREGFVDFKEQALPALAKDYRVSVVCGGAEGSVAVRTLKDYLRAVALTSGMGRVERDPLLELDPGRTGGFKLIEAGAKVGEGAKVIDSVVLAGATVEAGAVVVRSLIGTGVTVRGSAAFVDRLAGVESGAVR